MAFVRASGRRSPFFHFLAVLHVAPPKLLVLGPFGGEKSFVCRTGVNMVLVMWDQIIADV